MKYFVDEIAFEFMKVICERKNKSLFKMKEKKQEIFTTIKTKRVRGREKKGSSSIIHDDN
jgi:hypothetical protein